MSLGNNGHDFPTLYNPFQLGPDRNLSGSRTDTHIVKPTAQHRRVVALHLSGWSTSSIAVALGRHYSWVSNVLASPIIREIIERIQNEVDRELSALFPTAVKTIKDVMERGSDSAKIRAAELVLKSQGKIKEGEKKTETAEDVVAQILARVEVDGKAVISIGAAQTRPRVTNGGTDGDDFPDSH